MKIWFATGNEGKLREVGGKFADIGITVEQLMAPYPELQADTLREVVEHGLVWLLEKHGKPVMIDDSGLFIDALKGFPGVYSAYAFKTLACSGILDIMREKDNRKAHFECCAGFIDPHGNITMAEGRVDGQLIAEIRGGGGFGFDPIFVPDGYSQTFAEMPMEEKNMISHRGRAFEMLASKLKLAGSGP